MSSRNARLRKAFSGSYLLLTGGSLKDYENHMGSFVYRKRPRQVDITKYLRDLGSTYINRYASARFTFEKTAPPTRAARNSLGFCKG